VNYVDAQEEKPKTGVDVFVITTTGKKGIAKFWDVTQRWMTADENLANADVVIKWRYAEAK